MSQPKPYAWKSDWSNLMPFPIDGLAKQRTKAPIVLGPVNAHPELRRQLAPKNSAAGERWGVYDHTGAMVFSGRIVGEYSGQEPLEEYCKLMWSGDPVEQAQLTIRMLAEGL